MPPPFPHAGEAAALTVAAMWACGSLLFAYTGSRVGALATNVLRITIAATVLALVHVATAGAPWPREADPRAWALLGLSALLGLVVGDYCYFRALVLLGPRRATLLLSLSPVATAALGRLTLGEHLGARALAGIAITLAGTAWVVSERSATWPGATRTLAGSLHGLGAALGQALGLVLSKAAAPGLTALGMADIRMTVAAGSLWIIAIASRRAPRIARAGRERRVLLALLAAAGLGPIGGVWLMLWSITHTETAVAATLMSLVPVLILPLVMVVHHERPSPRAVLGALIAMGGVALLLSR